VNLTLENPPYFSNVCNRNFYVRMTPTGGNQFNFLSIAERGIVGIGFAISTKGTK